MSAINWNIHTYATLLSTQEYVLELAEQGLPEGTVVQSLTQTKGRGRQGRTWESPMGNLYMSFLLRPDCSADKAAQLSFVTALAVSAAMEYFLASGHEKTLKWPNDILIDGKKCAGILIESIIGSKGQVEALVVGTGVNILTAPDGAVFLKDVGKGQIAIHPFRDQVLAEFGVVYKKWKDNGFQPIRKMWLKQAHKPGQPLKVSLPGEQITGKFKDLDPSGALVLTLPDGTDKVVHTGDVMNIG